jgi:hypothetical protein
VSLSARNVTSANLSLRRVAKRVARCSWPSPRTLTAKCPDSTIAWQVGSLVPMQTSSCSGSIDSDATALAVMPAGPSAVRVVITATPVVNREMA